MVIDDPLTGSSCLTQQLRDYPTRHQFRVSATQIFVKRTESHTDVLTTVRVGQASLYM
ncbi:hypothetical protein GCM10027176_51340 [Actinoallomurus bryophytorum]